MFLLIAISVLGSSMLNGMENDTNSILVKTLTETFPVSYQPHTTIGDLKKELVESQGVPVYCQKIVALVPSTDWYVDTVADFMATETDPLPNDLLVNELVENYGNGVKLALYLQNK